MRLQVVLLCVFVTSASAASLPEENPRRNTSVVASGASLDQTGDSSQIISSSGANTELEPQPGQPGTPRTQQKEISFNDWFSQLSLWIQIPLAVLIFFLLMFILVIILNIIFFWCALCCACGLACFIPDDYVRF